ncbi:vacuolar protein sorting-associated protein VTA1-like [Tropilaelaps mercedesae]|uniref:Vacuolar protein sorting-associated protein VTA1-like n=1 Tax=Tropilaelaps mercedesae TaxID=418985 RepID=A0A1V9Y2B2_9ACAR|nr:vacuolar protein sorting-associated protein VTA1-like [Tropilaelaps mercedesae]
MATGGGPASQVPPSLKAIAPFTRIAAEHDSKSPVIAYWCRFYALSTVLKMQVSKSPAERAYLAELMDILEKMKADNRDNEAFSNDIVAQSTIEAHALKLFTWANQQDRNSNFDKSVIRAFHAAGYIFEVLNNFGELSEDAARMSKYAKWKAAYIHRRVEARTLHERCIKDGIQPVPGPLKGDDEGFEEDAGASAASNSPPHQSGSSGVTPDAGITPTPMPRGNIGGLGQSGGGTFDMGLPDVPHVPRAPKDERTGAYPKVPPVQQPSAAAMPAPDLPFATPAFAPPPVQPEGQRTTLNLNQRLKAQKYCKFASSALNYDDVPTAVSNLHKALTLLTTGVDSE